MNSLELNAIAEGMVRYLKEHVETPVDGIGVLGVMLLMIFDQASTGETTLEAFAEDFRRSLVDSYKTRSDEGLERVQ